MHNEISVNFTSRHSVSTFHVNWDWNAPITPSSLWNMSLSLLASEQPLPRVLSMSQSAVPFLTQRSTFTPSLPLRHLRRACRWLQLKSVQVQRSGQSWDWTGASAAPPHCGLIKGARTTEREHKEIMVESSFNQYFQFSLTKQQTSTRTGPESHTVRFRFRKTKCGCRKWKQRHQTTTESSKMTNVFTEFITTTHAQITGSRRRPTAFC